MTVVTKEKSREYQQRYYYKNLDKVRKYQREWHKVRNRQDRLERIKAYGGKCTCCGEKEPRFLTLEHFRHDGKKFRNHSGANQGYLLWLKRNGYPKDGITLYCMNCNWAERFNQPCPHKASQLV
jgi:hypothetical protein